MAWQFAGLTDRTWAVTGDLTGAPGFGAVTSTLMLFTFGGRQAFAAAFGFGGAGGAGFFAGLGTARGPARSPRSAR